MEINSKYHKNEISMHWNGDKKGNKEVRICKEYKYLGIESGRDRYLRNE